MVNSQLISPTYVDAELQLEFAIDSFFTRISETRPSIYSLYISLLQI